MRPDYFNRSLAVNEKRKKIFLTCAAGLEHNGRLMKKNLTAEQLQRREERKTSFAALIKKAAEMSDEERSALMAGCNIVNCDGHALSPRNQMFLIWQLGRNVTIVGGFRQWLKQGRCVRKGEHGASILFPRVYGDSKAKAQAAGIEAGTAELTKGRTFFLAGTVFDVSQTDILPIATAEATRELVLQ